MINCTWCDTGNLTSLGNCKSCGAPLSVQIDSVHVDLSGLKGPNSLTIRRLRVPVAAMLPGASFKMSFDGNTATLTPKQTSSGMGGTFALGDHCVAVGPGGIYIQGNVQGSVNTGKAEVESEKKLILWLPSGVTYVVVSGNGKTEIEPACQVDIDFANAQTKS